MKDIIPFLILYSISKVSFKEFFYSFIHSKLESYTEFEIVNNFSQFLSLVIV